MSDEWEGLDGDNGELAEYFEPVVPGAVSTTPTPPPTPTGPLVSPLVLDKISQGPGASPPSRSGPGGLSGARGLSRGLAAFTAPAVCEVKSLARLAYLFFVNASLGDTPKALGTLGVFRYLWNDSLATIQTGFTNPLRPIADVSWSADMQIGIGLSLIGALGESNTRARAALSSLPGNMMQVGPWFPSFRATLGPEDASIANYANSAVVGSDYGTAVAAIVRDDLRACLAASAAAAPSPAPSPSPAPAGTPAVLNVQTTSPQAQTIAPYAPRSSSGGSNPSIGGGAGTVLTVALLGLVGYGAWLAFKDSDKASKPKLAGIDEGAWLQRAKKAAAIDAPKMKCLPTAHARTQVSMDELAGRKGELLAAKLATLPPKEAMPVEEAYFAELDRIRPGAPRCV